MIPVLGVAYVNRPDLMVKMLQSIDVPVGRLVIVDNSADGSAPVPSGAVHIATGHNLGVAASWNLIIKSNPQAPYWCIANSDIEFGPGALTTLDETVQDEPAVYHMLGFAAFAITREAVAEVGWFDENIHPAYFEDNDYARRIDMLGVPYIHVPVEIGHFGSAVIGSDPHFRNENLRTFPLNQAYYIAKWGGHPGDEKFSTPFNAGGSPAQWTHDFKRLRQLTWRDK